jgi:tRNA A37 methylthiotransferase MiaB
MIENRVAFAHFISGCMAEREENYHIAMYHYKDAICTNGHPSPFCEEVKVYEKAYEEVVLKKIKREQQELEKHQESVETEEREKYVKEILDVIKEQVMQERKKNPAPSIVGAFSSEEMGAIKKKVYDIVDKHFQR